MEIKVLRQRYSNIKKYIQTNRVLPAVLLALVSLWIFAFILLPEISNNIVAQQNGKSATSVNNFEECILVENSYVVDGRPKFQPHTCYINNKEFIRWNINPDTTNWRKLTFGDYEIKHPGYLYPLVYEGKTVYFFASESHKKLSDKKNCLESGGFLHIGCPEYIVKLEITGGIDPADDEAMYRLLQNPEYGIREDDIHNDNLGRGELPNWSVFWFEPNYVQNTKKDIYVPGPDFRHQDPRKYDTTISNPPEKISIQALGEVKGRIFQIEIDADALTYWTFRKDKKEYPETLDPIYLYKFEQFDFHDVARGILSTLDVKESGDTFPFKNNRIPRKGVLYLGKLASDIFYLYHTNYNIPQYNKPYETRRIDPFDGSILNLVPAKRDKYQRDETQFRSFQEVKPILEMYKYPNLSAYIYSAKYNQDKGVVYLTSGKYLFRLDTNTLELKEILNIENSNIPQKQKWNFINIEELTLDTNGYLVLSLEESDFYEGPYYSTKMILNTSTLKYTYLGDVGNVKVDVVGNKAVSNKIIKVYKYCGDGFGCGSDGMYFEYEPKGSQQTNALP